MASRHFTPKSISSNPKAAKLNTSRNYGNNNQVTPRFKPKVQKYTTPEPARHDEKIMTLKRNHDGETEIKFPIENTKFIRETQKLFNKYFSGENNDDINTQPFESNFETPNFGVSAISKNSDTNKRLKTTPMPTETLPRVELKSIENNPREKTTFTARKDLLNENKQTENNIDRKTVHLVGHVEHIIKWDQMLKNSKISAIYNVLGTFINVINGSWAMEKCIFIRGSNGTVLECSFFEIDRPCPVINRGQFVGCLGQIIGTQKLRLYDIQILEEAERDETQRAIFLSQRMTQELNNCK